MRAVNCLCPVGGCRCNHSCSRHATGGAAALCPPPFLQFAPHWTSLPGSCWDGTLLGLRKPQDGCGDTVLLGPRCLVVVCSKTWGSQATSATSLMPASKNPWLSIPFHVDFLWDQRNSSCGWFKVFLKPRITLKGDSVLGWKSLSPAERSFCRKRLVSLMGKKTTGSPGGATGFAYEKTAEKSPWTEKHKSPFKGRERKKKKHVNSPLCLTPTKSIFPFIRTFCCIDQQHKVKTVAKCLYRVRVQGGTTRCHRVGKSLCRSPVSLTTPQCCKDLGTLHGTIKPKKGFQFLLVTAATFPGTVSHVDYKQFSLLSSCFPDQR